LGLCWGFCESDAAGDSAETAFLKKHGFRLKTNRPGFMVDVGAYHDGFIAPFAESGWKIIAFEPILRTEKYRLDSLVMFQTFRLFPGCSQA
jgi:hypothetical protein